MNRLLSFNPEPFETESELENVFQAYRATRSGTAHEVGFEWETSEQEFGDTQKIAERAAVKSRAATGQRDPNALTDMVFFKRHPELGGRRLRADERQLAGEWKAILRDIVLPELAGGAPGRPQPRRSATATLRPRAPWRRESSPSSGSASSNCSFGIKRRRMEFRSKCFLLLSAARQAHASTTTPLPAIGPRIRAKNPSDTYRVQSSTNSVFFRRPPVFMVASPRPTIPWREAALIQDRLATTLRKANSARAGTVSPEPIQMRAIGRTQRCRFASGCGT